MDRSGANEDTYPMLVISRLITVDVPANLLKWEEAQPKNLHVVHLKFQFTALLTQSGINFDIYMHQNLPQIFAETISPTVLCFLTYFRRDPVADELWVILGNNRRNIILDFNMLVKTLWNLVMTTFDNFGCPTSFARSTSCGSFIHLII